MTYGTVDMGGTKLRLAIVARRDSTEPLKSMEFPVTGDFAVDYNSLVTGFSDLEAMFRDEHGGLNGVGIGLAGKVNQDRRGIRAAGNVTHFIGQPFVDRLEQDILCPVALGNDAEAAALAEALFGWGQDTRFAGLDFYGLIHGSGIGGAVVRYINGRPVPFATEPGHIQVQILGNAKDERCSCGLWNCVEAFAGGKAIHRRFGIEAKDLTRSMWDFNVLPWLFMGMRNVLVAHPVDLVTFSGGVACGQPWLMDALEEHFKEVAATTESDIIGTPKFRISKLGANAGIRGALALLDLVGITC